MNFDLVSFASCPHDFVVAPAREQFGDELSSVLVAAKDPTHDSVIPPGMAHRIDRFAALAISCINGLRTHIPSEADPTRIGVFVGNVLAGWSYGAEQLAHLVEDGPEAVHPFQATAWFPAAAQGEITIFTGYKGPAKTFSGGRCCFGEAMLGAALAFASGAIDFAFVGMAESCGSPFLAWGSDVATMKEDKAEGAFFTLLCRPGLVADARQMRLQLRDNETTSLAAFRLPSIWVTDLSNSFSALETSGRMVFPLTDSREIQLQLA